MSIVLSTVEAAPSKAGSLGASPAGTAHRRGPDETMSTATDHGFTYPRADWVVDEGTPPLLILGCSVALDSSCPEVYEAPLRWKMKPGRTWERIAHQYAGVSCSHSYYWATVLTPRPEVAKALAEIDAHWRGTDTGVWGVTLAEIAEYNEQLRRLIPGATCERVYRDFAEALYPIDCQGGADVCRLATDDVPDDLNDLVEWEAEGIQRFLGSVGRWGIWALGANSD